MSSSSLCVRCSMQFTLFKRKNRCPACRMLYCSQCFKKGENLPRRNVKQCLKCHALSSHPFVRSELMLLSVRELKAFLDLKNVSATGCTEKSDLVDIIINHQARPQVNTTYAREPHASAQTSTPTASSQAQSQSNRNTQHASQSINDFFGLQINPEVHRFVESIFQMDDSGASGLRPPSRDELNLTQRTNDEYQPSMHHNHSHQFHMPWRMEFEPPVSAPPSQVATQSNAISLDSLKNANDIRKLSTKELKSLLDHNFVDYKGCVEKEELIQRALKLWESRQHLHNASSASSSETPGGENEVCKVCMDRIIDCVFLECGHLVTCVDCGRRLRECPLCRQNIVRIVRVFKS